jgi:nucleoside triphosphate diphosphatase
MADDIRKLIEIMAQLRSPDGGCPWDVEQTFATIAPHTIEEAYEVADAIEKRNLTALKDELGDLLFQVVFHAQMAKEAGAFDFDGVARAIADKMQRRHPHVFGGQTIKDAAAQTVAWEEHKARERADRRNVADNGPDGPEPTGDGTESALDGVILGLPALTRAAKLQRRAARVGFDWSGGSVGARQIVDKIREEAGELEAELECAAETPRLADEIGDLLFSCVNLARHLGIDPEQALRQGNAKFERRFRRLEALLAANGLKPKALPLETLEEYWVKAKRDDPED